MWGRLEWYYFMKQWYGDCVGIVEYLGEYIRQNSHLDDIKKIGYLASVLIIMLIALKAGEFLKNPNKKP